MGGQGKTQTALRYCLKGFQNRTFNTVLWIDATSELSANQAIESILSKAGIPTSGQQFELNLLAFKYALTSLKGPCLLVFDNYDTPRDFPQITKMFFQHEEICILLTSRHHESLRLGMPIHVRDMDQSDAEDLLLISSDLIRQDVDSKHLANTVNMLGYLPLALDQAGAYIRKLHLSLDLFEKHYIDKQKKILQYTPDLFEYRKSLSPGSEPSVLSVFTTWELSLEQLGDDRPHLEHLLTLSAFFDHNKVHEALFSTRCTLNFTACSGIQDAWLQCMLTDSAWDSYSFQDIIANLHGLSLLQKFWIEDGHIVFSLHPLVNDWLRTRVGEKDRASMIVEAAVTVAGMDGSLDLFSHLNKCFQALSGCAKILFHDCVDVRSPRTIADVAPVPKSGADELNPGPHYGRAEALCCPHGRPCQTIPSTIRLEWTVSCCITGIMFPMTRTQPQMSKMVYDLQMALGLVMTFETLHIFAKRLGLSSQDTDQLSQKLRRVVEEFKDQSYEDDTLSPGSDNLSQHIAILTLRQMIGTMSEWFDAHVKVKHEEEKGIDGSFQPNWKEALAHVNDQLKLLIQFTESRNHALIRDQLRSLPFLQSGF